jgi:hypothetical protein
MLSSLQRIIDRGLSISERVADLRIGVGFNTKDTKDTKVEAPGFPLRAWCPLCLLDVGIS